MKTYYLMLSKVFPSTHFKAGEPTNFPDSFKNAQKCAICETKDTGMCKRCGVVGYLKKHTIRANYEFWAERFKEIETGEACLSIRQWTGKPYCSKQVEIARLTREDGIGLQRLTVIGCATIHPMFVDGHSVKVSDLAHNDGLSETEWRNWFSHYNLTEPMAVIQFTKFRY